MEVQEETMALVIKGKRTKRPRPNSPLTLPMVSTSSSAVESERFSDNSCPTTSFDFATTSTEEEEDMANCLILLAQGRSFERKVFTDDDHHHQLVENYQCKTCNRCFSSFQALGGHRASHKKPKNVNEEKKTLLVIKEDEDHISQMSTALSLQLSNRASLCVSNNVKVNKVHECSICGAEFSSGQALGGHMRRHRAFISNNTTTSTALSIATSSDHHHRHHLAEAKRKRNLLHLDLNLPAPEDDCRESKFSFSSKEQVIVFSASSLVDCHY
ncbi:zinc finger protein ZAT5-like [Mangifera indica]|uniref:zinc finger protein ZAT5-like n=1 Tax=Mangifera indica TaxID=29780 RepID=UPI001CFAE266|nr:zinc finger protein ZAT5-like [Mangifera indica]